MRPTKPMAGIGILLEMEKAKLLTRQAEKAFEDSGSASAKIAYEQAKLEEKAVYKKFDDQLLKRRNAGPHYE